ncbi:GNAT family N-acetyltransferase [candidate division WWE3 bacterium]|nr:GNAT family N-acetyltransferase [candidate division WWE3 bacterium]
MRITKIQEKSDRLNKFLDEAWDHADKEHYPGRSFDWEKRKFMYTAVQEDEIVGYIEFTIQANVTYLDEIIVSPKHYRKSIGKKLMEKVEEVSGNNDVHKIYFETGENWRSAVEFYKKLGYKIEGSLPRHFGDTDYVIFAKYLK